MKKPTIISLAIIALIIMAIVFVLADKKADAPSDNNKSLDTSQTKDKTQPENTGQYVEYDKASLANSQDDNYLFFHAPWCPQCQAIEASISAGGEIPENVTIYKVDYDSNQELRKKYGVTLQTTFVQIDGHGNFIRKYVAYDEPTIKSVVENFINK